MKYVVYYIYNCIFKILKSKFVKTKFFLVCIIVELLFVGDNT